MHNDVRDKFIYQLCQSTVRENSRLGNLEHTCCWGIWKIQLGRDLEDTPGWGIWNTQDRWLGDLEHTEQVVEGSGEHRTYGKGIWRTQGRYLVNLENTGQVFGDVENTGHMVRGSGEHRAGIW